ELRDTASLLETAAARGFHAATTHGLATPGRPNLPGRQALPGRVPNPDSGTQGSEPDAWGNPVYDAPGSLSGAAAPLHGAGRHPSGLADRQSYPHRDREVDWVFY